MRSPMDPPTFQRVTPADLGLSPMPPSHCPEPHHAHQHDEKAHRAHHWKERLFCLSCCTALHVVLEVISHYWK